jgi:AcrR family transcriptional regulator
MQGSRGAIIEQVKQPNATADETSQRRRELRRDAVINRDRVLAAAATAIRREGAAVPLATIAADAGVGVGTLYRRYSSRQALLAALTLRSFQMVLEAALQAVAREGTAIDSLREFIDQTIEHGADFVLPLHGGPIPFDEETIAVRTQVHDALQAVLDRGIQDGTIRSDLTAFDVIVFGALLAQPLPHVPGWKRTARRQAVIYLDGLRPKRLP